MPKGGKRNGAGRPKGSTQKMPAAKIASDFAPRILELLSDMLNSKSARNRKWAIHEMLPYAVQRQPQAIEHSGTDGRPLFDNITVKIIGPTNGAAA